MSSLAKNFHASKELENKLDVTRSA